MNARPSRPVPQSVPPTAEPSEGAASDERGHAEGYRRQGRRRFLRHAALVSTTTVVAGWAALAPARWPLSLRDPDGERGKPRPPVIRLPEAGFAVEATARKTP